nr:uncharacterized protein LOC125421014 [Ziziphus jujuba var. spinosa]
MNCKKKNNSSWLWSGILKARSVLAKGMCYKVGKGNSVNFWEDPWVPNTPGFIPKSKNLFASSYGMVNSLKQNNGEWDEARLNELFNQDLVQCIKEMFWANNNQEDILFWSKTKSGIFSVKTTYNIQEEVQHEEHEWWKTLWGNRIHEQTKFFMWKLANSRLPVTSNLMRRGMNVDREECAHGCNNTEDEIHVFFHCEMARRIWFASPWGLRWELLNFSELTSFLKCLANPSDFLPIREEDREHFFIYRAITLEYLW